MEWLNSLVGQKLCNVAITTDNNQVDINLVTHKEGTIDSNALYEYQNILSIFNVVNAINPELDYLLPSNNSVVWGISDLSGYAVHSTHLTFSGQSSVQLNRGLLIKSIKLYGSKELNTLTTINPRIISEMCPVFTDPDSTVLTRALKITTDQDYVFYIVIGIPLNTSVKHWFDKGQMRLRILLGTKRTRHDISPHSKKNTRKPRFSLLD